MMSASASTSADTASSDISVARPFNLLRWFSALSLLAILVIGCAIVFFLTRYLTAHMLLRDAEVSRDFIESIVAAETSSKSPSRQKDGPRSEPLDAYVYHIANLPDVIRANLYAPDRSVTWSSDPRLIGQRFHDNDELDKALRGEIVVKAGRVAADETKPEHVGLPEQAAPSESGRFVEAYLPIRDEKRTTIVGVVELYKLPRALFDAIDEGVLWVWTSVALGGLLLYFAFFWIVRRADKIMRAQRDRLIETETVTAIGEMAAALAHGIRNPLASIRSAAEVACEEDGDGAKECLQDIMRQTDRIDGWVRELLAASQGSGLPVEQVDLNEMVRESLQGVAAELRRRGIDLTVHEAPLPPVRGNRAPLAHAFGNIVSNAIEAMPQGGHLHVESRHAGNGSVQIAVEDTGAGVGLGLPLARRILERHAGRIELESAVGRGTRVVLTLPAEG
jgi:two-component system sensor histidine kinase HydH